MNINLDLLGFDLFVAAARLMAGVVQRADFRFGVPLQLDRLNLAIKFHQLIHFFFRFFKVCSFFLFSFLQVGFNEINDAQTSRIVSNAVVNTRYWSQILANLVLSAIYRDGFILLFILCFILCFILFILCYISQTTSRDRDLLSLCCFRSCTRVVPPAEAS